MADVTINLNEAKKITNSVENSLKRIDDKATDIVSNISALLDTLLKGANAFNGVLKEAQKSFSGVSGTASGALGTNTEQLANSLASLTKSLEGFDSTKTLMDFNDLLPEDFLKRLEEFNRLAEQSSAAKTFAKLRLEWEAGTLTLGEYTAKLTRTVEELQKGDAAAKMFSDAVNKSAEDAQKKLNEFPAEAISGLIDTFSKTVAEGGDIGAAMNKKLKDLGTQLLDNVINSLLKDLVNGLMKGSSESLGSGITGMLDGVFSIFTKIFGIFNAQGNVFGPHGVMAFAGGGIVSQPTLFGFANGIGLMGEAGAEAIMPLGRDSRGNLGVRVADSAMNGAGSGGVFAPHVEINVENKGGGDMTEEQAKTLGSKVKTIVEMQVAKQMYEYMRNGTLRPSTGRGY